MANPAEDSTRASATAEAATLGTATAAPTDAAPAAAAATVAGAAVTNPFGAEPFGGELSFLADGGSGDGDAAAASGDAASFFAVVEDDGVSLDLALKPTSVADHAATSIAATYRGHRQRRAKAERGAVEEEDGGAAVVIYAVGTKVDCRFGGLDDYYRGVVEVVNDGGRTYDIRYDDGDREHGASSLERK
jgi:hypothetical protein